MAITARKIQDLSAAKGYLKVRGQPRPVDEQRPPNPLPPLLCRCRPQTSSRRRIAQRALWSIASSTSLSPLWSPLWLRLHQARPPSKLLLEVSRCMDE